ncbi:DUF1467 family protein [Flexibacterium corallicola]|uniref:DUF1467 family protein n=1 Tax=Flexibacterium corallicola TaxID=3037259 RepID=UPI00286F7164|nr:DUF1467 family protein [Pseudovibrio sp. M1P-2-3]
MSIVLSVAVFFMMWWILFLAILPFGIKTQAEEGETVHGSAESAPVHPYMLRKVIANTIVTGILFAIVYVVIDSGLARDLLPLVDRFMGN